MLVLLTSPSVVDPKHAGAAEMLDALARAGWPVGVVSNHPQPDWFEDAFPSGEVHFVRRIGRQDGTVVKAIANDLKQQAHDVIVLGASDEDLQMAKNGRALLVVAGWAANSRVAKYGLSTPSPQDFNELLRLVAGWPGGWFFEAVSAVYSAVALADLSSYGYSISAAQKVFGPKITQVVKSGGPLLNALLTLTSRSMLMSGMSHGSDMMFGVYPSSSSKNNDSEVLSDFAHRLRTVTSNVRLARKGEPLFIRHKTSSKRSHGGGGDRTDPSEQIESVHLNPAYRGKIDGRYVYVLDDCTTYGVSFGVAAGFLRAAGAKFVTGIALGKFGDKLRRYDIDIQSDPFKPVRSGNYTWSSEYWAGTKSQPTQHDLQGLIG